MSFSEAARSHLDKLIRNGEAPGIQYLAVTSEHVVFEYADGWADIAGGRRLDSATTMMAYSMSKTITAAAILQLVEARKVNLDAAIDTYLETQPYGADVTVRQLLSHTSGIPNPIPLRWVHAAAVHDGFDERAALSAVLKKYPRLSARPGSRFRYSNIGYWLLGRIVEEADGEPFRAYVAEHVLKPLGVSPRELGYAVADRQHHAKGYLERCSLMNLFKHALMADDLIGSREGRWQHLNDHYVNGAAFGGLVGAARGFGKFLQDQVRPRSALFLDTTRQLFYAPQHIANGSPIAMTLGWHIGAHKGVRFFYKEGGGGGFRSMMRLYDSAGMASVVMTNATNFLVSRLLDTLDPWFL